MPWVALVFASIGATWSFPLESSLDNFLRLFFFGAICAFGFGICDELASKYRRKVLFKNPDLKAAFISSQLAKWEEETE